MPERYPAQSNPALTGSTPIASGAVPFFLPGGAIGIAVVHGYGGSIGDYRVFGQSLHQRGYTVSGGRLAGHGQGLEALRKSHLADWQASVDQVIGELRQRCSRVVVVGASFGATLALDYAQRNPTALAGLVLVNPALLYRNRWLQKIALMFLRTFTQYYPKFGLSAADKARYAELGSTTAWPIDGLFETDAFIHHHVIPHLARVTTPMLVLGNEHDPLVSGHSLDILRQALAPELVATAVIPGRTHRPFRDPAATEWMVARTDTFIRNLHI